MREFKFRAWDGDRHKVKIKGLIRFGFSSNDIVAFQAECDSYEKANNKYKINNISNIEYFSEDAIYSYFSDGVILEIEEVSSDSDNK